MQFEKLDAKRISLRMHILEDLEDFFAYRRLPEVARYQNFEPFTHDHAATYLKKVSLVAPGVPGQWFQLAIVLKETGTVIGDCSLRQTQSDPRIAEIGFNLSPVCQGKGFAKEAVLCLLEFAFSQLSIHRIFAVTDVENTACINLLASIPMRQEGHFIQNIWFKGGWGSEYVYALLKEEYMLYA